MSSNAAAEIYFIGAMMVLILVICTVAMFFFIRQYRREMKAKGSRTKSVDETSAASQKPEEPTRGV